VLFTHPPSSSVPVPTKNTMSNKRPYVQSSLVDIAKSAACKYPNSNIEIAFSFLEKTVPQFIQHSENDRFVKVGRSIVSILSMEDDGVVGDGNNDDSSVQLILEKSLQLLVQECQLLVQHHEQEQEDGKDKSSMQVPKVRFGKTELQMPIVTLGCMRFQQQWGDRIKNVNMVNADCQDNLVSILRRAIVEYGVNHIETARGYGCSDMQLGVALKQLYMTGEVKREDLIIQSKVNAMKNPKVFRAQLETTMKNLQVDYLDLFAVHGLNGDWSFDWLFGDNGDGNSNCWDVVQEFKDAGKIRHVGFSTHGPTELICKSIETGKFDYVNLHHHFCGSYTASGDGPNGIGNIKCLRLLKEMDMGAFVISVTDKGGKIYEPSRKLRSLTLPDLEPMTFGCAWLWNLHELDPHNATVHTFSIGAARPSDLDQFVAAANLQKRGELLSRTKVICQRLEDAKRNALGQDWVDTCYEGIIKSHKSKYLVEHTQTVWLYNCIKAWGMYKFAKDRFNTLVNNRKKYDPSLSHDENIDKIGRIGYGYMPGLSPEPQKDYFVDDLAGVPEKNREVIQEAYAFMLKWCGGKNLEEKIPKEWESSYEMKPWKDYPDRSYPYK